MRDDTFSIFHLALNLYNYALRSVKKEKKQLTSGCFF